MKNKNIFSLLASMDLKTLPDAVLLQLSYDITAETLRRNGVRNADKAVFSVVRKRLKNSESQKRRQDDLFLTDWDDLYPDADGEKKFYVYAHSKPCEGYTDVKTNEYDFIGVRIPGVPFYIGKGCGERAFDLNRNGGHGAELKSILKNGGRESDVVTILAENLTESEAFKMESKLIYLLGTRYEIGEIGMLVNLDVPKRPAVLNAARIAPEPCIHPIGEKGEPGAKPARINHAKRMLRLRDIGNANVLGDRLLWQRQVAPQNLSLAPGP